MIVPADCAYILFFFLSHYEVLTVIAVVLQGLRGQYGVLVAISVEGYFGIS